MKLDEFIHLKEICPKCNNTLMVQKKSWSDMSGALYYVFCEPCHCKGKGANDKETALEKFHKELARKEKLDNRKPEKILTDIRNYLVERKNNTVVMEYMGLWETALADLAKYAEKLGVEL